MKEKECGIRQSAITFNQYGRLDDEDILRVFRSSCIACGNKDCGAGKKLINKKIQKWAKCVICYFVLGGIIIQSLSVDTLRTRTKLSVERTRIIRDRDNV